MAQATREDTGFAPRISALIRDPALRAIFERAERDLDPDACSAAIDHPPTLSPGAAELLTCGARRVLAEVA